jgi:hypothetical protein
MKQSALHIAARKQYSHVLQVLVDARANLNARTQVLVLECVQHIERITELVLIVQKILE